MICDLLVSIVVEYSKNTCLEWMQYNNTEREGTDCPQNDSIGLRREIFMDCGSFPFQGSIFLEQILFFCCCRSSLLCCNELRVVYEAILVLVVTERKKDFEFWYIDREHFYLSSIGSIIFFNSSSAKILASGAGRPDFGSWLACKLVFQKPNKHRVLPHRANVLKISPTPVHPICCYLKWKML